MQVLPILLQAVLQLHSQTKLIFICEQKTREIFSGFFVALNSYMSFKIVCYTMFDITFTGVSVRSKPDMDHLLEDWLYKRNTQCNFDTIIQAISLRSQPENMTIPNKIKMTEKYLNYFGSKYSSAFSESFYCWSFEFQINHASVFANSESELGALYSDCEGIPMVKCGTEYPDMPSVLNVSFDLRNIYFSQLHNT